MLGQIGGLESVLFTASTIWQKKAAGHREVNNWDLGQLSALWCAVFENSMSASLGFDFNLNPLSGMTGEVFGPIQKSLVIMICFPLKNFPQT